MLNFMLIPLCCTHTNSNRSLLNCQCCDSRCAACPGLQSIGSEKLQLYEEISGTTCTLQPGS